MKINFSATLRKAHTYLITALIVLFGHWTWQHPVWLTALKIKLAKFWQLARNKPLTSLAFFLALWGISMSGWYSYQWWHNRPQPITIDFVVTAPERTAIENDEKPHPLVVTFDASVAPLELVAKDINQGITIKPSIAGQWHWLDDRSLEFKPTHDWLVGQTHQVTLNKSLVAPQILLARQEFEFSTAQFIASIDKAEFFQDPVDPNLKKTIFQLHFSHPVDPIELEKKLTLKLNNTAGNTREEKPLTFTVVYDKLRLNAYIHSSNLAIPQDNQVAELVVAKGVQAAASNAVFDQLLTAKVTVPGQYFGLSVDSAQVVVTPNPISQSQDQVLMMATSLPVDEKTLSSAIKVWQLPAYPPNTEVDQTQPYSWNSSEITDEIVKQSRAIEIKSLPTENDYSQLHSFVIHADVKQTLWVTVDKGLKSFGGYLLSAPYQQTAIVPEYPKELHIMGEGSLLTLSGEKKIALMVRDLEGVKIELGRVLPEQLQHLISQSDGAFGNPDFKDRFSIENLSERFETDVPLPTLEKGKVHYQPVDLSPYLLDRQGKSKRGIFFVKASDYSPSQQPADTDNDTAIEQTDASTVDDKRLIVMTDLGIIAKTEKNGGQVVFVQSIHTGKPELGAEVDVIAKNGLSLMHGKTDTEGKVRFATLSGLTHDRQPVLYLVRNNGDMSFLPFTRADRLLNFSRFDVGGAENAADVNQLDAYLFSDRGLYRPGDTMHIGMIVKTSGWNTPLTGLPLEAEILDPRGLTVKREKLNLADGGLNELTYETLEASATGSYSVNLYTVKDNKSDQLLGHTKVKVEEFQPDRMKISANFSKPSTEGWLNPKDLQALINVQNLYGAPAEGRQVTGDLTLQPALPAFKQYPDYHFYDPHYAKQSYTETLAPSTTDTAGNAVLNLGLEKYQGASYRLELSAQAFEAAGGRSVAIEAGALVSDLPFLLGYKADGTLNFIAKNAQRNLKFIAVDPQLKLISTDKLTLEFIEHKIISVLTKQDDGTFRYESRSKENSLRKTALSIPQTGFQLSLDSTTPGDYSYLVRDGAGLQLARVDFSIAGQGNVSRSLDRNAELQLSLDKAEYKPGDKIAVNIRAPYTGAGLITIERDKVYASTWFKADTEASVQYIEVPKGLMGNGYVTVQYIRDPGSDEIFMSPLSFGAAPFQVSLAEHQQPLTLSVPDHIKPGEMLAMQLHSNEPGKAVVFAVDEGILQVARYKNPDPLRYFFQKRKLDVDTTQILDLILPEYKKLLQLSAPGGDGEEEEEPAASLLNPFKRKHDQPAVFWSGIVNLKKDAVLHYQVPETFNGRLRVLAIAVNDNRIASAVKQTQVRDDLIITPNTPFMIAPGDEFSVSVALANHVKGSGDKAPVQLKLTVPPQFELQEDAEKTITIAEGHEGVATYRIKTRDAQHITLGSAALSFEASSAGYATQRQSELSIRPATPKIATMRLGNFTSEIELPVQRQLFSQQRKVSAGVSPLPLIAASGLIDYLDNFTHSCTEQLVSKAVPALLLSQYPELSTEPATHFSDHDWLHLLSVLRSRQNAEGGFGIWAATPQAHEFASVYTLHLLMEAKANSRTVPEDMLQKLLSYVQILAISPANLLDDLRVRAYAAYLLTRQGLVTTTTLASIRESLHSNFQNDVWQQDLTAVYLAASYQLLQQHDVAQTLLHVPLQNLGIAKDYYQYQHYYDPLIRDTQTLYLLAKHFPESLKKLSPNVLQGLAKALQDSRFNTLSSAYFLLAYPAYSQSISADTAKQLAIIAIDPSGKEQPLQLPQNSAPRTVFPEATKSLRFKGPHTMPTYYAISESGFDQLVLTQAVDKGLEIQRTYLNAQGQSISKVALGEEITVQIRMRAIDREWLDNIAVQDLLPAGFEVVLQNPAANSADSNSEQENTATAWQDRLAVGGNWHSDYADVREDRVLLYGSVSNTMAEYRYRIKANTAGIFTAPPVFAQSMYEPTTQAYSQGGSITVE